MLKVKFAQSSWILCGSPARFLSPWNSLGQNTGVGSYSFLHGIFPTQGLNPGLHIEGGFFTIWATRETQNNILV